MRRLLAAPGAEGWIANAIQSGEVVTPCLVLDFSYIDRVLGLFAAHLPNVELFYSVKANDDPALLSYLQAHGAGFDVASVNEIAAVLGIGAKPAQIILSNTIKTPQCVREIFTRRISATTIDNEQDLKALALEATFHSHRPRLLVRIKVPATGIQINLSEKFGCTEAAAGQLLKAADELGLEPDGIHFHVGTQCRNVESYAAGIDAAIRILESVNRETRLELRTINIGGGFPDEIVAEECGGLERFFEDLGAIVQKAQGRGFTIIAEPGRVIASGAGIAVTQVIGKSTHDGRPWLYLDGGIYGLFSTAHYEKRRFEFIPVSSKAGLLESYVVAGPTCDALDVIGTDVWLPSSLEPGDYLIAFHAGAYSISVKSNFNGMGDISTRVSGHAIVRDEAFVPARKVSGR